MASLRNASSKDRLAVWFTTYFFCTCTIKRCRKDSVQNPKLVWRKNSTLLCIWRRKQTTSFLRGMQIGNKIRTHFCMRGNQSGEVCFQCGAHNFTPQHIPQCRAGEENVGKEGHFARCCGKFNNRTSNPWRGNSSEVRRVIYLEEDSSEGSYDENTDKIVFTISGIGEATFVMKGRINSNKITARVDSGSLVTIFTVKDLKDILRTDVILARPLPQSEKYVEFKHQPMKITNSSMCH